ncbi:CoA transferase [Microbacterium sp. W1N]|uniref:CoA transferase n=1 Tax=Microbacterium festucae TaxID=2977531 RepID=UPI0021BE0AA4|nr:CoA transferase [Microbacterium festucae]MCT9821448.1 CoA transferase [Microbacterium festucae]
MDDRVPLPAHTDVAGFAAACVQNLAAAVAEIGSAPPPVDPQAVALAYTAERHLRIAGERPAPFAELSGFFACRDGWVRTHGNYPHHARALREALMLPAEAGRAEAAVRMATLPAAEVSAAVARAGGLCAVVAREDPARDAALRSLPLVRLSRLGDAPARAVHARVGAPPRDAPLRGIRVLDLTRVLAGPTCTQTLALWGATVLRIDPPALPEIAWQHVLTGHGKRSALLDIGTATGRARWDELLASADVVVLGYRPAALARLGLSPAALAAQRPGVIVAELRAWEQADRRGFDSIVQAASGISWIEGDADAPGALPAQALDYSAGFLMAAAVLRLLRRRAAEGGSWLAQTSLRRVAAELLGRARTPRAEPADARPDATGRLQHFTVGGRSVITAAPPIRLGGRGFAAPRPWGEDEPRWDEPFDEPVSAGRGG